MNDTANKLREYSYRISYSDGPLKSLLHEACHCIDSRNTWVEGGICKEC